jgi:hypothetical protein
MTAVIIIPCNYIDGIDVLMNHYNCLNITRYTYGHIIGKTNYDQHVRWNLIFLINRRVSHIEMHILNALNQRICAVTIAFV